MREISNVLENALVNERITHAYLFVGPEDARKEEIAMAFARALLCFSVQAGRACGVCRDCRQAEHVKHPDLHIVQPAGATIKIEQIRAVQQTVFYRPYQGKRQVYLIKQADTMTVQAANCFLKTLEEPPEEVVFILLATWLHALLPTVRSRCQQFFLPPAVSAGISKDEWLMTGELAERLYEASAMEALGLAEKVAEKKETVVTCLNLLALWYFDLLLWQETGDPELLANPDRMLNVEKEAVRYPKRCLVHCIEEIEKAKERLSANANTRLVLEVLLLHLAGMAKRRY